MGLYRPYTAHMGRIRALRAYLYIYRIYGIYIDAASARHRDVSVLDDTATVPVGTDRPRTYPGYGPE